MSYRIVSINALERQCCVCLYEGTDGDIETMLGTTAELTDSDGRFRDHTCCCLALFHRSCLKMSSTRRGTEVNDWRDKCAMGFELRMLPCVPD